MKRIIITGASSGIGQALAFSIASSGIDMLLLGRNEQRLSSVKELCKNKGAHVEAISVDLRNYTKVYQVISCFFANGGIDLLFVNAGVAELEYSPSDSGPDWELLKSQVFDNFDCSFSVISATLSLFAKQFQPLHCVVISSFNAFFPVGEAPGYCVAKAAQKTLVDALEDYYSNCPQTSNKIKFSTVFPGFVDTRMAYGYNGPRLFELTSNEAANRILRGMYKKRKNIIFPRRLMFLVWLSKLMPPSLLRRIISSSRAFKVPCS